MHPDQRRWAVTLPRIIVVSALVLALAGCGEDEGGTGERPNRAPKAEQQPRPANGDAKVLWRAPDNPLERTVEAGLDPERKEFLIHHVHAHLDVFVDGEPIVVPAGIGINIDDPAVRRFKEPDGSFSYGGIDPACRKSCISPLHTHDVTGILHTESKTPKPNTLGQFFTEWGVHLSESCVGKYCDPKPVAFYVNGKPYDDDPRAIELTDRKEIAIVIGTPPATIPKTADLSNA
jgi:hypothetical protein